MCSLNENEDRFPREILSNYFSGKGGIGQIHLGTSDLVSSNSCSEDFLCLPIENWEYCCLSSLTMLLPG